MKHLNKLIQFSKLLPYNQSSWITFFVFIISSLIVWFAFPAIYWSETYPFQAIEKRAYIICAFFLIWLLSLILIPKEYSYAAITKEKRYPLEELKQRFQSALTFLKKTSITYQNQDLALINLPWYLVIGPAEAGKTSLLANAPLSFVLQKQFAKHEIEKLAPSTHIDFWATRQAIFIDVPSHYFKTVNQQENQICLWNYLIKLIKQYRGALGLQGIIITLPLAHLEKEKSHKNLYQAWQQTLTHLESLQQYFATPLPCQLILTQCDHIPGFKAFFADSTLEDIHQIWGTDLPQTMEQMVPLFNDKFNQIIKRINQQLLARLHHERNPLLRPFIKDFPFQLEKLRNLLIPLLKTWIQRNSKFSLQGIYFTSAIQPTELTEIQATAINHKTRTLQLFDQANISRPYFIKQLLSYGLPYQPHIHSLQYRYLKWKKPIGFSLAASAIIAASLFLGKDFNQSVKSLYVIQQEVIAYRTILQKNHDSTEQLHATLTILNKLNPPETHYTPLQIIPFISFYTQQTKIKTNAMYQQLLRTYLLPSIKNYLEDYLSLPVNKDIQGVYAALKTYLMLNDISKLQSDYIANTLQIITPSSFSEAEKKLLAHHVKFAFQGSFSPLSTNAALIKQTRTYLNSMPGAQLSYIILKNISNYNAEIPIDLTGQRKHHTILVNKKLSNRLPAMFFSRSFTTIYTQDIPIAAAEAFIGNWVLGEEAPSRDNPEMTTGLIEQLRTMYVNNYIDLWENMLANIEITKTPTLAAADQLIKELIKPDSVMTQFLHTIYTQTYFEPIASNSPKLQAVGVLTQQSDTMRMIYNSFVGLHHYLQPILQANNPQKKAFQLILDRMLNRGQADALTQMHLVAAKSPEPLKTWLDQIANQTWHHLLSEGSRYLDLSWRNEVWDHLPTNMQGNHTKQFVKNNTEHYKAWLKVFGNEGALIQFYNTYLQAFVDTSQTNWQWKTMDNDHLLFSNLALKHIQDAIRIQQTYFTNTYRSVTTEQAISTELAKLKLPNTLL